MTINIKENIRPVSDFRKDTARMLKQIKENHDPIILTQRGRSVAVILDVDSYERLNYDGRFRASITRGLKDADAGRVTSHEKAMKEIRESIKRKPVAR